MDKNCYSYVTVTVTSRCTELEVQVRLGSCQHSKDVLGILHSQNMVTASTKRAMLDGTPESYIFTQLILMEIHTVALFIASQVCPVFTVFLVC